VKLQLQAAVPGKYLDCTFRFSSLNGGVF